MSAPPKPPLKTAVYIDGYNLYYGRLRGTHLKWLDVVSLFDDLLVHRSQNEKSAKVYFFTAHALATFASHGQASVEAQSAYHRALKAKHDDRIEFIYGKHSFDKNGTLLPTFIDGQPYDRSVRSRVWKPEEKKTDVNLALRMYRDAAMGLYDRMILVSNDSDAEPTLHALREDFPKLVVGVVMPLPPADPGSHRRPSGSLANLADWTINALTDEQLRKAQLPDVVPTKKKAIKKPAHWFAPADSPGDPTDTGNCKNTGHRCA